MNVYLPTKANLSDGYRKKIVWSVRAINAALGRTLLRDATRQSIQAFLGTLSPGSRSDVRATLHGILDLAVADGLIAINPVKYVKLQLKRSRPEKPYDAGELALLISASRGMVCHNAIVLAAGLGLRRGECVGAKWSDLKDGLLTIERQRDDDDLKTGNSYRTIPVPQGLLDELDGPKRGYISKARDLHNISGQRRNETKDVRARGFHRAVELAGVRRGPTFHSLRHSCSTLLVISGAHPYIKDSILGHTKQTMGQHYTDYSAFVELQRSALEGVWGAIAQGLPIGSLGKEEASA